MIRFMHIMGVIGLLMGGCSLFESDSKAKKTELKFEMHSIFVDSMAGYARATLVDMDKDGDLDFVTGSVVRTYWFEYVSDSVWNPHLITTQSNSDVGGVSLDIDGDGWVDHTAGSLWFKNPGTSPMENFESFNSGCLYRTHDMEQGDMDGDGIVDVISLSDQGLGVSWCKFSNGPEEPWQVYEILPVDNNRQEHSGMNVGDIDGDGDLDVSMVTRWVENVDGKGESWQPHDLEGMGIKGIYGYGGETEVADLDGDGDNDIVVTEADISNARVGVFENLNGKGTQWNLTILKDSTDIQNFHSLKIRDFNNDGRLDIFTCNQKPESGYPYYIWLNLGGLEWEEKIIFSGVECHDAVAGDVDGDGDMDIVSNGYGFPEHIFLENKLID